METKFVAMRDLAGICLAAGLPASIAVIAVAVAWAESRGNLYAVNINENPGFASHLSTDLGAWQTNTFWHPEITSREAFDPERQIIHVIRMAKKTGIYGYVSYNWSAWNSYVNGYHKQFISLAEIAVAAAGGVWSDEMPTLYRDSRFATVFLVNDDVTVVGSKLSASLIARGVVEVVDQHDDSLISFMRKARIKAGQLVASSTPGAFSAPADLVGN